MLPDSGATASAYEVHGGGQPCRILRLRRVKQPQTQGLWLECISKWPIRADSVHERIPSLTLMGRDRPWGPVT